MLHVAVLLCAVAVVLGCQPAPSGGSSAPSAKPAQPQPAAAKPAQSQPAVANPAPGPEAPQQPGAVARAPLAPPVAVTVADNLTAAGVGLFVALEQGYFTTEGLDVTVERVGTSGDLYPQLAAGRFDVGASAAGPTLFNAALRGIGLKVVADQSSTPPHYKGTSGLVVTRANFQSGRFAAVESLRGATIGVSSFGGTGEFRVVSALGQVGLGRDDVNLTPINFAEINTALANGAVDAGWQVEPFMTIGLAQGDLQRIEVPPDRSGVVHVGSVMVYGENFIAQKSAAAERFMVAYLRGIRDNYEAYFGSGQGREAVIAALIKHTPLKDPALYERMGTHYQHPDGYVALDGLQRMADWSVASGYTQQPVDVSQLVDNSYVERALAVLGRYPAAP
jgi:NitT/TauT family transport system substrate-binding protein